MKAPHSFRLLLRAPGFAAASILTLGLGIGISTVLFTLYDAVALKPIGARAPKELVRISGSQNGREFDAVSFEQYSQVAANTRLLQQVVATSAPQTLAARLPEPAVLRARFVSENYFEALGVSAWMGRPLQPGDRAAAVISYDFWRAKLNSDPAALARQIRLQNVTLDIIGIAPQKFAGTGTPPQMPDAWIPAAVQAQAMPGSDWLREGSADFQLIGRRKPGAGAAQISAELSSVASTWPLVNGKPAKLQARAATFFQTDSGEFESFSQVCGALSIAVALILMIGSVNLVNQVQPSNSKSGNWWQSPFCGARHRRHFGRAIGAGAFGAGSFLLAMGDGGDDCDGGGCAGGGFAE